MKKIIKTTWIEFKKHIPVILIIVVLFSVLAIFLWLGEDKSQSSIGSEVIYYGVLRRFSTSGTMGFNYYDIDKNEIVKEPYYWFWAGPDIDNDSRIEEFVDFIYNNKDAVFKITGTRLGDDDYYECESCGDLDPLHTIDVEKIEVYKSLY